MTTIEQRIEQLEQQAITRQRRKLMGCALVVVVLMGLFPPWESTARWVGWEWGHAGYGPIWDPPRSGMQVRINFSLLVVQWFGVSLVTGALWFVLAAGDDKARPPPKPKLANIMQKLTCPECGRTYTMYDYRADAGPIACPNCKAEMSSTSVQSNDISQEAKK